MLNIMPELAKSGAMATSSLPRDAATRSNCPGANAFHHEACQCQVRFTAFVSPPSSNRLHTPGPSAGSSNPVNTFAETIDATAGIIDSSSTNGLAIVRTAPAAPLAALAQLAG